MGVALPHADRDAPVQLPEFLPAPTVYLVEVVYADVPCVHGADGDTPRDQYAHGAHADRDRTCGDADPDVGSAALRVGVCDHGAGGDTVREPVPLHAHADRDDDRDVLPHADRDAHSAALPHADRDAPPHGAA